MPMELALAPGAPGGGNARRLSGGGMDEAIVKDMSAVPETLGRSQLARATPGWAVEETR